MTNEMKQEYTLRISRANKTQLVVILYEMLLEYIEEARFAYGQKDTEGFALNVQRAVGCIRELNFSINYEAGTASNLFSLFVFCNKELSKAVLHNTAEELYHVERIAKKLLEATRQMAKTDTSEAVMGNTQSIYAGLTYGKEALIVHLNAAENRGYQV